MVPSSWLSVLFFFLFVAPGTLFLILSKRRRTAIADSAFVEISRIVLASLAFSGLAFLVLALVYLKRSEWLPSPRQLLGKDSAAYFRDRYGLVLWTIVVGAALACIFAWLWHLFLSARQGGATIRHVSAWTQVLKEDQPDGYMVLVRVRLDDGLIYLGRVLDFSSDLETEGRELVLGQPLSVAKGGAEPTALPDRYKRVVIPGDSIKVLSVEYRPVLESDPGQPAAPPAEELAEPRAEPGSRSVPLVSDHRQPQQATKTPPAARPMSRAVTVPATGSRGCRAPGPG